MSSWQKNYSRMEKEEEFCYIYIKKSLYQLFLWRGLLYNSVTAENELFSFFFSFLQIKKIKRWESRVMIWLILSAFLKAYFDSTREMPIKRVICFDYGTYCLAPSSFISHISNKNKFRLKYIAKVGFAFMVWWSYCLAVSNFICQISNKNKLRFE